MLQLLLREYSHSRGKKSLRKTLCCEWEGTLPLAWEKESVFMRLSEVFAAICTKNFYKNLVLFLPAAMFSLAYHKEYNLWFLCKKFCKLRSLAFARSLTFWLNNYKAQMSKKDKIPTIAISFKKTQKKKDFPIMPRSTQKDVFVPFLLLHRLQAVVRFPWSLTPSLKNSLNIPCQNFEVFAFCTGIIWSMASWFFGNTLPQ